MNSKHTRTSSTIGPLALATSFLLAGSAFACQSVVCLDGTSTNICALDSNKEEFKILILLNLALAMCTGGLFFARRKKGGVFVVLSFVAAVTPLVWKLLNDTGCGFFETLLAKYLVVAVVAIFATQLGFLARDLMYRSSGLA